MTRKIVATPDTCGGLPRFDGTRLTMSWYFGLKLGGWTDAEIISDWTNLSQQDLNRAHRWCMARVRLP